MPGGQRFDHLAPILPDRVGRCGPASDDVDEAHQPPWQHRVDGLNEALLAKAAEAKLLRTNRVRADTTVVPANVCYPGTVTHDRLPPLGVDARAGLQSADPFLNPVDGVGPSDGPQRADTCTPIDSRLGREINRG